LNKTVGSILAALLIATAATSTAIDEILPPAAAGGTSPFLFASRDAVLMSWLEPVPNSDRVALRFARFSNGEWSEARTIAERKDFFVNSADFPSIVEDPNGVLFVHWLQ